MKQPVASPCISVCEMDEATGWCTGCLRTLAEIAAWSVLDDPQKLAVRRELSRRRVAWRRLHRTEPGLTTGAPPCSD